MRHWVLRGLFALISLVAFDASAQPVPPNASPSLFGSGWQCDRGYYRSANECLLLTLPPNAELDLLGNNWQCRRGFYRSGNNCLQIRVPQNAELSLLGNSWQCKRGFFRSGDNCSPVQLPQNAELTLLGNSWQCKRGFYRSQDSCRLVELPPNAELSVLGNGWSCKSGYMREGNSCRTMTAEEAKAYNERMARLNDAMQKRAASADCETESQSGAEVCLTMASRNFDCEKLITGTSYSGCTVSISYNLRTDYKGRSSIDVEVECTASIDTKKRNGISGYESDSNEETHTLYAEDDEGETMELSFDFSTFDEVYRASVSSTKCEINDVSLN